MDKWKRAFSYPLLWLFGGFILVFTLADLLTPTASFSEFENRYLKQRPSPTLTAIFDGTYTQGYETYLNDQFVLRNQWINLKSQAEAFLLKVENNGIVYGSDGQMFEKDLTQPGEQLQKNLGYLEALFRQVPGATLAIVPSAYEIYPEKLPIGLKMIPQKQYIDAIYKTVSALDGDTLDLYPTLSAGKEGYLYYKTDHHWTTYGAYLSYLAYCSSKNLTPMEADRFSQHEVSPFYGTYFNKSKNTTAQPDVLNWYDIPMASVEVDGVKKEHYLDLEGLEKRDKYGAFLWGNNGVTVLKGVRPVTQGKEPSRLLIVKDSFANCLAPFFTANYDEVWVVDLRSYPKGFQQLIADYEFTDLLVLYNFNNLVTDTNFYRLNY